MAQLNLSHTLTAGTPENINDVQDNFQDITDHINNGLIGTTNLTDAGVTAAKLADAATLGLTAGATIRRGKSIIATEESRTNVAYGKLTTPDQVSSIVLPTDGLMFIAYQALWKCSAVGAAEAAIFLGANQLRSRRQTGGGSAGVQSVTHAHPSLANHYLALSSAPHGLVNVSTFAATSDVTTGQVVGAALDPGFDTTAEDGGHGVVALFAAAGTYDVSVQFKASSGSVTVKERKLWVWTMGF